MEENAEAIARQIVSFAACILRETALQHAHAPEDFQCTLLAVVIGRVQTLWLTVGDGDIIFRRTDGYYPFGSRKKSTLANLVQVVIEAASDPHLIQCGLTRSEDLVGAVLCSDGASERLISRDGKQVAGRLDTFLNDLADGRLQSGDLRRFLRDEEIWRGVEDDKSIALLRRAKPSARDNVSASPPPPAFASR